MAKRKFPGYLATETPEQWRVLKRKQWRAVQTAYQDFKTGCAFTPAYPDKVEEIERLLAEIEDLLRGRWVSW